jgi:putative membrane protein
MMGWGYGMGGGWLVMTLSWVLLMGVIIALVVWIFPRDPRRRSGESWPAPNPREVLDQRLSRGEIDVETYRTLRQELSGSEPWASERHRDVPR